MLKRFLKSLVTFIIIGSFLGEILIRVLKFYVDVPIMDIDKNGLIRMKPNQEGLTIWGHKWVINRFGEYGYEPEQIKSFFTVIGDSYIANTVNPPCCHQAQFLSSNFDSIDFYPKARDGAGFVELVMMANSLNTLKPIRHLLYVHHGDFTESIYELGKSSHTIQWSYEQKKTFSISFNKSINKLKGLLYKSRFAYYLYRTYFVGTGNNNTNNRDVECVNLDYEMINGLLKYIDENFITDNITLVFSPDSDKKLVNLVKQYRYDVLLLTSTNYESWKLEHDSHWSCAGHKNASDQVVEYILKIQ